MWVLYVTVQLLFKFYVVILDHRRSGVVDNFGRVCLSVSQTITFENLDVERLYLHFGIPPETGQFRI